MRIFDKSLLAIALAYMTSVASAATVSVISDDFENGLSQWTGKNNGAHSGVIVADPLDPTNNVLSFNQLISAGDLFTIDTLYSPTGEFRVSFDYLGLPGQGGISGDLGGYFGISQGFPGTHFWVAGTGRFSTPISLIDDGQWHHYDLTFNSPISVGNVVRLMLEDWSGSGGVAGDAYFDNFVTGDPIQVAQSLAVPEPATAALLLGALGFVGLRRGRVH